MSAPLLCLSWLSTKTLGLDRTVRLFERLGKSRRRDAADGPTQRQADRVTRGMQFLPLRIECLDQAIVTWYLLNRHGHAAALRIGMRLTPVSGHAWVVCDQDVFVHTPGLEDFTVVATYAPWSGDGSTMRS